MKRALFVLLAAIILFAFCPISYAENTVPMRGPVSGFDVSLLHHRCIVGGITKTSSSTWNRSFTVNVSSLSKPSDTYLRITLVDHNGNAIGGYKNWSTTGTKTLTLNSNMVNESSVYLQLRNTAQSGNIVTTGDYTGTYY